ncbi:hypothetical protein [Chlorobium sp.]|uniref:hypothetical protein n=1 Tax=Chlorobium sp. TaxID=1095 RepID=UPI0025BDBA1D|nr:hypothetical protein [Chlorobium sp.]
MLRFHTSLKRLRILPDIAVDIGSGYDDIRLSVFLSLLTGTEQLKILVLAAVEKHGNRSLGKRIRLEKFDIRFK